MTLSDNIREDLLSKILDGTYPTGSLLPSEQELTEIYSVSRPTVRQALQSLASSGYLDRKRRRGTIVTMPKLTQSFAISLHSFEDTMREAHRVPHTKVLLFKRQRSSNEVAKELDLRSGDEVFRIVRLRYADEQPNVFVETFVPCSSYPDLDKHDFNEESLYATMEALGRPVRTARRVFETSKADANTAALLDMEIGDPILLFHTVACDEQGKPVEYSIASYRGMGNSFEVRVSVL